MFFLLGNDKAEKKAKQAVSISSPDKVKELFRLGRFPVVTTQEIADRKIAKVLGLVCCRGFDADEAFFGMAAMAQNKGGQAIIGYNENVAFHPDGSKFFSCFGTAVMFERDSRDVRDFSDVSKLSNDVEGSAELINTTIGDDTEELLNLAVSEPEVNLSSQHPSEDEDPVLQRLLAQKQNRGNSNTPIQ